MRRVLISMGVAALLTATMVLVPASPAAATVTVTTSGTVVTVDLVGNEPMRIDCNNGVVVIRLKTGTPAVPCGSLTKVIVNGDGGIQTVYGEDLDDPLFTADPSLEVHLGAGNDDVRESAQADVIDLGAGDDVLHLSRSAPNTSVDLGTNTDEVRYFGSDDDEVMTASSTSNVMTFSHTLAGVTTTTQVTNAERLDFNGRGGDDVLDASGVTAASTIDGAVLFGSFGDDVLLGPDAPSTLFGGVGDNQIVGGTANDNIGSASEGDTISPGGGADRVYDRDSLRSGRTIDSTGFGHTYTVEVAFGDAVSRVRPSGSGTLVTTSLTRTGQQLVPSTFQTVVVNLDQHGEGGDRSLIDLHALAGNRAIRGEGDVTDDDLVDITIPYGGWTTSGTAATTLTIDPTDSILGTITLSDVGEVRIHGPWTNKNAGFVHRVTRDLMFRFATGSEISSIAVGLGDGETTRPAVVAGLMDTDEYRGLDVDRTFVKYLRRTADPAGRTYWITSIRNGKALWRFRAQLFGSNEYFTKAGGENEAYLVKVYNDVLGRDPDPSGKAYWLKKLNGGADRGSVALQFINGSEFRRYLLDEQFLRFLDRRATTAEQTTWSNVLKASATGEQQLIAFLAASTSYYDRT